MISKPQTMKSNIYTSRIPFSGTMLLLFFFLISFSGFGQKIITFGPGSGNQNLPFDYSKKNSRSASIYKRNDLKIAGIITRLDWNVFTAQTSATNETIDIYLGETSNDVFTNPKWDSLVLKAQLVAHLTSGNFTIAGWKNVLLNTVFNKLSANSNLLVLIEKTSTATGNIPKFTYDNANAINNHAFSVSDNAFVAPGTLTADTKIPDIRFEFALAPSGFKVVTSTLSSLTLNWALNGVSDSVLILKGLTGTFPAIPQGTPTVRHEGDSISGTVVAHIGKDISFINSDLNSNTAYYYRIFSFFVDNTGSKHFYYSPYLDTNGRTLEAAFMISFNNQFTTDKDSICIAKPDNDTIFGQPREGRYFQWYAGFNSSSELRPIIGANSKDYIINHSGLSVGIYYYCRHDSVKNQTANLSNVVSFKIFPLTVGGSAAVFEASVCQYAKISVLLNTPTGNVLYWVRIKPNSVPDTIHSTFLVIYDSLYIPGIWKYWAAVKSGLCDQVNSAADSVNVIAKPTGTATITKSVLCSGESTKITLSPLGPGEFLNWQRDKTSEITGIPESGTTGIIEGAVVSSSQSNVTVTFNYWIKLNQCTSDKLDTTILVKPAPALSKITGDSLVCSEVQLYDLNVIAGSKYQWTINPTTLGTAVGKSDTTSSVQVQWNPVTSPATGSLTGVVTNRSSGCSASGKINIVVSTGVAPGPEQLIRKLPAVAGELFLFCKNFINQNSVNYNYTWGYENSTGEITLNPDYQDKYFCLFKGYDPTKGYRYFVQMNDKASGKACFTRTYYTPLPTELAPQNDFSICPNPNAGSFKIEIDYETLGSFELSLFDILGHECARLPLTKSLRTESFQISVSSLMRGTYVAMIKFPDGNQLIKKMVIY